MEKQYTPSQVEEITGCYSVRNLIPSNFKTTFPGAYEIADGEWRLSESDLEKWISCKKNPRAFIENEINLVRRTLEWLDGDAVQRMKIEGAISCMWFNRESLMEKFIFAMFHLKGNNQDLALAMKKQWDTICPTPFPYYLDTSGLNIAGREGISINSQQNT